jgi:hypothetical protein
MRVHANDYGDGGAKRGDLCEREVHENDAALDDVNAEVGMNASKYKTSYERRKQKKEHVHSVILGL